MGSSSRHSGDPSFLEEGFGRGAVMFHLHYIESATLWEFRDITLVSDKRQNAPDCELCVTIASCEIGATSSLWPLQDREN